MRQQAKIAPASTIVASVLKTDGVRGLWRGVVPPMLVAAPQFAISFACFDINRRLVRGWFGRDPAAKDELVDVAAAGALVAIPTTFMYAPADRVKCLLQHDGARLEAGKPARYLNARDCASKVLQHGGLRSLFSGFWMTLARDVPGWAGYFAVYHSAKTWLAGPDAGVLDGSVPLSPLATLAAGGIAGASTWAVCIPMDVLKTRWQSQPLVPPHVSPPFAAAVHGGRGSGGGGSKQQGWRGKPGSPATLYRSYWHLVTTMVRSPAGFGSLFAGFGTIVMGGIPRDAACFGGTELMHRALSLWLD